MLWPILEKKCLGNPAMKLVEKTHRPDIKNDALTTEGRGRLHGT